MDPVLAVPACETHNKDRPGSLQLSSCYNWGRETELREAQWILNSVVFPQLFMHEYLKHSEESRESEGTTVALTDQVTTQEKRFYIEEIKVRPM